MTEFIRKKLDEIVDLVRAGRADAAEVLCREALAARRDDVSLLGMLGAILLKRGAWDEAERTLLTTIELAPEFAKPHEDLGVLYLARKQPDRAAEQFERALALEPGLTSARRGLAAARQRTGGKPGADGRSPAAVPPALRKLTEASELRRRGEYDAAEQICQEILKLGPENIAALRELAKISTDRERYVVAEGYLRRILKLAPQHLGALLDLGRFLGQRGRYPEAIRLMEDAARLGPENPDVHLLHGDMLAIVGRSGEALGRYEKCLGLRPDDPQALLGAGHMLRIEGRRAAAEESYRRCTQVRPEIGEAWWNLASLRGYTPTDNEISVIKAELERDSVSPESEVAFRFALARACERRKDYPGAWSQYELGNAGKRALVRYDPVDTEVQLQKIRDTFGADLFRNVPADTPTERTPVFIVGMPRSGSTLLEQILASHSRVQGTGELPYIIMLTNAAAARRSDGLRYPELVPELSADELTGLGRSYLHHALTHAGTGAEFFTDKMPANFPHVGFIRLVLPHAKIIDARRDPLATCVANYRQLFAQGKNQSYDLTELGEYYLQYVQTMNHWDAVIPGAVLRVQYEDVVADLGGQVRRLLDFCGLPFEESCVNFHENERPVNTASAEQVREPIYRSGVDFWKNYEPWLDELRQVLAPVL
ncbi:MAG: sulfotransferase [Gammaproteobacteria bacterium]|nr:sulfotransferase [Gammaproteobacteria bacterium]MDH5311389.1 sulfotransferase [Gammaproteobacteria bacterium]